MWGVKRSPSKATPSKSPPALALLQGAPGTLVLLGRALLAGACLCFLSVGIRRRFAPRLRCKAWQALSCTDNL